MRGDGLDLSDLVLLCFWFGLMFGFGYTIGFEVGGQTARGDGLDLGNISLAGLG